MHLGDEIVEVDERGPPQLAHEPLVTTKHSTNGGADAHGQKLPAKRARSRGKVRSSIRESLTYARA